jgi:hypothetical protein
VFDSIEEYHQAAARADLEADESTVLVVRGAGPKGYPGMPEIGNFVLPSRLLERGVIDMVRISDARMSGTGFGTVVLHVAPEAVVGGPLALVRTGDWIELDVPARTLTVKVSDDELARRRAGWVPPESPYSRGYARLYVEHVLQADQGADLDFLVGASGSAVSWLSPGLQAVAGDDHAAGAGQRAERGEGSLVDVLDHARQRQAQGQLPGDVRQQVRHDRNVEEPGEAGDAQERGDSAYPADVRLQVVAAAGQQHVPELRLGIQALAGRDRNVDGGPQGRISLEVLRRERFFQPEDVVRFQRPGGPACGGQVPQLVRVDHEQPGGPDDLPDRGYPLQVLIQAGQADLDLDSGMTRRDPAAHLLLELIQRQVPVDAAGVHGHRLALPADQVGQAQPGGPGLQIPQADIDRCHRQRGDPPARFAQVPPQPVPGRGRRYRAAHGDRAAVRVDHGLDRLRPGLDSPAEALPGSAIAALHGAGDQVLVSHCRSPRPGHRQPVGLAGYPRDLRAHDSRSASRAGRQNSPPRWASTGSAGSGSPCSAIISAAKRSASSRGR